MGKVCATCGTENRERALFCRGCSGSLKPASPPPEMPLLAVAAPTDDHPSFASTGRPKGAAGMKRAVVGLLLAAAAVIAWLQSGQPDPSSRLAPAVPATLMAEQPKAPGIPPESERLAPTIGMPAGGGAGSGALTMPSTAAPPSAAERVDALIARNARLKQDRLESEKRARLLASQERSRAAQDLERRQAEQTSPQAQRPNPLPAASEPLPPRAIAKALTVGQICDNTGNFIARYVCRVRECSKAPHASDPICVTYREMEEAQRTMQQNF